MLVTLDGVDDDVPGYDSINFAFSGYGFTR